MKTFQIRSALISWSPETLVSTLRAASGPGSHTFTKAGRAPIGRLAPDNLDQEGKSTFFRQSGVGDAGRTLSRKALEPLLLMLMCCQDRYSSTRARSCRSAGYQWSATECFCARYFRIAMLQQDKGRESHNLLQMVRFQRPGGGASYLSVRTKFPSFMTGTFLTLLIFPNSSLNC